jgi:long-chain acyl-CoA synthetase
VPDAERPLLMLFSSGSEGRPKTICYTRATLNTFLHWQARLFGAFPERPASPSLSPRVNVLPLAYFGGLSFCLQALLEQRAVHLLNDLAPAAYLALVRRSACQLLLLVPTLYQPLLAAVAGLRGAHPVRYCLALGEAASPQLTAAIGQAFGVPVISAYGMSECLSGLGHAPGAAHQQVPAGSCGRLLFGAVMLVDLEGNESADCGELWVTNATTTPCYLHAALNQARYRDGWYRTGDLFRRDAAGWYYYQGRVDALCISNGCKVWPQEVEAQLLQHPQVADCLVVPLQLGNGRRRLGALVRCTPQAGLVPHVLIEFWLAHGALHATPAWVTLVDALPLNANGKRDRLAAAQLVQQDYTRNSGKGVVAAGGVP